MKIKMAAVGSRKGWSQEKPGLEIDLKPPTGRGELVGKFCVADTASVFSIIPPQVMKEK